MHDKAYLVDFFDEHFEQFVEYTVQIVHKDILGRVLGKVNQCSAAVCLNAWILIIVKDHKQTGYDLWMILFLERRRKVGRHLTNTVARSVSHSRMLYITDQIEEKHFFDLK